ncbi:hypothetical protein BO71DRAFT_402900 [Aspergillus ellipticus CBS 707.79]|uniref:WD40 repeat-like protein n=1 Tax=Aspergillus ellipticus CBS 707.79 TaxID=1448320 RepID=A0A319CYH3_9EURO|nr:hypothetical protein BO71DRAFT_402900 [Aspergillus ellipticus CBS 707.79]
MCNTVLSNSENCSTLWDFPTGTRRHPLVLEKKHRGLPAFSYDSRLVAAAFQDQVIVLDAASGKLLHDLPLSVMKYRSCRIAFLPDSKLVLWESDARELQWDLSSKSSFDLKSNDDPITGIPVSSIMAFSPDNTTLAVESHSGLELWDLRSRESYSSMSFRHSLRNLRFSDDGKYLLADRESYRIKTDNEGRIVSLSHENLVTVDGPWISVGKERVLWLPAAYRSDAHDEGGMQAIHDDTVVIGTSSGEVSFIGFDPSAERRPLGYT